MNDSDSDHTRKYMRVKLIHADDIRAVLDSFIWHVLTLKARISAGSV